MTLLVSLIGEQPMPNLLPLRYLKPEEVLLVYTKRTQRVAARLQSLLEGKAEVALLQADPYDFSRLRDELREHVGAGSRDVIFNVTGGTKLMALAAYAIASESKSDVVYLRTEGPQPMGREARLYRFTFGADGALQALKPEHLVQPLITLDDYFRAHFDGYEERGANLRAEGGELEAAVANALKGYVDEMKAGVRPSGLKDQVEIDLAVRQGNQVGFIEVKRGGEGSGKKGVDQLTTSAARELGGTYTARFLVTGAASNLAYKTIAEKVDVTVIELADPVRRRQLSTGDGYALRLRVLGALTGNPRGATLEGKRSREGR